MMIVKIRLRKAAGVAIYQLRQSALCPNGSSSYRALKLNFDTNKHP